MQSFLLQLQWRYTLEDVMIFNNAELPFKITVAEFQNFRMEIFYFSLWKFISVLKNYNWHSNDFREMKISRIKNLKEGSEGNVKEGSHNLQS